MHLRLRTAQLFTNVAALLRIDARAHGAARYVFFFYLFTQHSKLPSTRFVLFIVRSTCVGGSLSVPHATGTIKFLTKTKWLYGCVGH